MKKMPKLASLVIASLMLACSATSNLPKGVNDPESALLSVLMVGEDIVAYNCKWAADYLRQVSDLDNFQAKGANEVASTVLSGTCSGLGTGPFHVTLRHELYLYKTSKPREISSYLVILSEDTVWRNFDSEVVPDNESVSKCATNQAGNYQDCFFVSIYDQIVSVVWINSNKELQDIQIRLIAADIIGGVEKRIPDLIK